MAMLRIRLRHIVSLLFRSLFSRSRVERELDEEFKYHIERQTEEYVAAGMNRQDARRAALRDFAGVQQRKEECRDTWRLNLLDNIAQDLRFSLRQLRKSPGFAGLAIFMLAMGIAASVSIFAFVDAALIKPLPYREPSRLVAVYEHTPQCPECNLSYQDYLDWKRLNHVFSSLEAYVNNGFVLSTPNGPEPAMSACVSAGFFRTLGVAPILGRDFSSGENRSVSHTVLLSNSTWRNRYGSDPNIVGKTATLDGAPYVIIGVLPDGFQFAPVEPVEFWATLDPNGHCEQRRGCHNLYGVARLKDGVSVLAALADTKLIARQLERQYPDSNRGQGANVIPLTEAVVGQIRPILLALLGGAGLLLLIVCVNLSSLLLVRSEGRRREMAVRSALGASRGRLIRQFATEGFVLVAAGTALGVLFAEWAMRLLTNLIPENILARLPFLQGLGLNVHLAVFAGAISLASAALFSLTPILSTSFSDLRDGLVEGGRGSAGTVWRRLGSKLVVAELATAVVLLVGAALLGQSLYRLLHVNLGFEPDHLATLMVAAPLANYGTDVKALQLQRTIVSQISSLPGVESAALASDLPAGLNGNTDWIRFVGRPYNGEHNEVNERDVSSEYFKTIGAKLLRGRYFTDDEDQSKLGVVIINQSLAARYFSREDPIGKQIGDTSLSPGSIREIIGIVDDIREGSLDSDIWPAEYVPLNQTFDTDYSLVVRTSQPPQSIFPALTGALRQIDSRIVTLFPVGMRQRIEDSTSAYLHRSSALLVEASPQWLYS